MVDPLGETQSGTGKLTAGIAVLAIVSTVLAIGVFASNTSLENALQLETSLRSRTEESESRERLARDLSRLGKKEKELVRAKELAEIEQKNAEAEREKAEKALASEEKARKLLYRRTLL